MRAYEISNKDVVQTVLIYRIKSWVVTYEMLNVIEGFHHGVDW